MEKLLEEKFIYSLNCLYVFSLFEDCKVCVSMENFATGSSFFRTDEWDSIEEAETDMQFQISLVKNVLKQERILLNFDPTENWKTVLKFFWTKLTHWFH